jgi:hypothetical protein
MPGAARHDKRYVWREASAYRSFKEKHKQNVLRAPLVYSSLRQNTTKMSGEKLRPTEASVKTRSKCLARTFRLQKLPAGQKLQAKHDQHVWQEPSVSRSFRQNTTKMSGKNLPSPEASGKTRPKCLARSFGPQKPQAKHDQNVWQEASVYRSFRQNTIKMSGKKLRSTEASGKTRPKCLARSFRLQKLQAKHDQNVWQEASVYRSFKQNTCRP